MIDVRVGEGGAPPSNTLSFLVVEVAVVLFVTRRGRMGDSNRRKSTVWATRLGFEDKGALFFTGGGP